MFYFIEYIMAITIIIVISTTVAIIVIITTIGIMVNALRCYKSIGFRMVAVVITEGGIVTSAELEVKE